ncbi:hypothetical protein DEU56DRAFT_784683 [Suillus clintonianus]|uniref:uncharacterized protein n=1 Tax=Suillus clintonianus TaxID=1904413 RepID=UPI001B87BB04|nr:uncharacterized protein DEU56DRAFT_784683 [Suillus clintonianus]KAG2147568.1 hypothetical protein DEU56DRAFT_784683 [Suillus clintonianus]
MCPYSSSDYSRSRPLHPLAEQRERALALHYQQHLGNQPTPNVLHTPEYDEFSNQQRMMRIRDVLRTRMPEDGKKDFYTGFPSYCCRACQLAEILQDHAIRDREREASIRKWQNFAAFHAQLEEEQLFARHRANAENFLAEAETFLDPAPASTSKVPIQDEPSLKDMFMAELRLMAEYRAEVRDTLQSILACLSEGTSTEAPVKRDPVPSPAAQTADPTPVNVNREETTTSQEGKGKVKEFPDSDTEEPSASPAKVASSLSQITSVASRLDTLLADFHFPAELDFSPSQSPSPVYSALDTADVFALTYTPINAPLRAQEHALSLLLTDLDNVPSFGSQVVRGARRAVVARVKQALEELEKGVEERRSRAHARKADSVIAPVYAM